MRRFTILATCLCYAAPALAHEFWIDPAQGQIDVGDEIVADLRVGEGFAGSPMSFFPAQFARFEITMGETTRPVEGRLGDMPALRSVAESAGLAVVVHETVDNIVTYRDRATFDSFVEHKDLSNVPEAHAARGLPEEGFQESYRRYAKSLIAVGDGAGTDRAVGMRTEFVALANPYTDDLSNGFPLLLLLDDAPRADAQVEVFARDAEGEVTVDYYRTDEAGEVTIAVTPATKVMVDAVVMEDTGNNDPTAGPVWHSDWANLTFIVPEPR